MKHMICLCLTLILILSLVPAQVRAAGVTCQPGDTIDVVLSLAGDGDQPDGVMGRLLFDTDIFTLLPSKDVIGMDGINLLNRQPVTVSFRVSKYAPAGQYTIEVKVIEAYDADGKKYTNARINPVRVTVMSAATAAPERTPAPTPTGKPLALPSAAGMEKKQIKAGDYVTFGIYPQTASGTDKTPIEWLVLEVQGNKALLLSRYGLDAKPYNTKYVDCTWETCTLRSWLNQEFLNKAFSRTEQSAILTTNVDNSRSQGYSGWSTSGGNNTQDRIFLLSCAEANKYLGVTREDNMKPRVAPTAYAVKQGAYTSSINNTADGTASWWWWLRSHGRSQSVAADVSTAGGLSDYNVDFVIGCVRPALWVNLDAGIF